MKNKIHKGALGTYFYFTVICLGALLAVIGTIVSMAELIKLFL